jgi:hypothetical protein
VTYVLIGLGIVVGLVLGFLAGLKAGAVLMHRPVWFWLGVGVLFVAAVLVTGEALLAGAMWMAGAALGVLTGGLTGLKYGRDAELRSLITPPGR